VERHISLNPIPARCNFVAIGFAAKPSADLTKQMTWPIPSKKAPPLAVDGVTPLTAHEISGKPGLLLDATSRIPSRRLKN
jgi:hypothetical protein